MPYNIRPMEEKDIEKLYFIEEASFSDSWSKDLFFQELNKNKLSRYIILEDQGNIRAYGGIWLIYDAVHITTIAVDPSYRNQGLGKLVLERLIEMAKDLGYASVLLEVRESNESAKALYRKLGFIAIDIRKEYYIDNREDAIIMVKSII